MFFDIVKRNVAFLIILLLVTQLFVSCTLAREQKTYTNGVLSITMDTGFSTIQLSGYDYCLESSAIRFSAKKASSSDLTTSSSLTEYTKYVYEATCKNQEEIYNSVSGRYMYFSYNEMMSERKFFYSCFVFKSVNAFWICEFSCMENMSERYKARFVSWADTITFVDSSGTASNTNNVPLQTEPNTTVEQLYSGGELSVKMDPGFTEGKKDDAELYLSKGNISFTASKESFSELNGTGLGNSTVDEYANAVAAGISDKIVVMYPKVGTYRYFTYVKKEAGHSYFHYSVVIKSDKDFWVCSFICFSENRDSMISKFEKWASTITV